MQTEQEDGVEEDEEEHQPVEKGWLHHVTTVYAVVIKVLH